MRIKADIAAALRKMARGQQDTTLYTYWNDLADGVEALADPATIRDRFAEAALKSLIANDALYLRCSGHVSVRAYEIADAMMAQREVKHGS
jgi:hypothetical protein